MKKQLFLILSFGLMLILLVLSFFWLSFSPSLYIKLYWIPFFAAIFCHIFSIIYLKKYKKDKYQDEEFKEILKSARLTQIFSAITIIFEIGLFFSVAMI